MRGSRSFLASLLLLGAVQAAQRPEAKAPFPFDHLPIAVQGSELKVDSHLPWAPYPLLAFLGKVQSTVRLRVLVGPEGNVLGARALEGPRELLGPAEAEVRKNRFKPVMVEGKPVFAITECFFPFSLKGQRVDPGGKPVTGFVLHVEPEVPTWGEKMDLDFIRREVQARLGALGLEARDPATADPEATLDLTLQFTGKTTLDLALRASLAKDRKVEANVPGEPVRVWTLQSHTYLPSKAYAESSCRGLLTPMLDTLFPVSPYLSDWLSLLLHEGDPAFGVPAWDPAKLAVFTAKPKAPDFAFSQMRVKYQPPAPPYPALAKIMHVQGTVVVEVLVDPMGTVVSARALEGPKDLFRVAEDYTLQWRFEPALLDGVPQAARFKLSMPFRLH